MSDADWNESSDDYARPSKRRRKAVKKTRADRASTRPSPETQQDGLGPFDALLRTFGPESGISDEDNTFESFIEPLLEELIEASAIAQVERLRCDDNAHQIIPMSRLQSRAVVDQIRSFGSPTHALIRQRLRLHPGALRASILNAHSELSLLLGSPVSPMSSLRSAQVNPVVLDALYAIKTTPYPNSFLRRLLGRQSTRERDVLAVDWESRTPWMDLMRDIRDHFTLMHPDRELPHEVEAPIEYASLQPYHLGQVHELLGHAFWAGIDVSDALQYSPERCTVIASYKNIVVGVALLSSPLETYITYLAVKPGWDNAQIATSMLYHLITLNPHKDIMLHVSINNPAVLLYNRFGFKAEEFVVGFYEDYLDTQSRASKNAFRLRLRQS